MELQLFKLYHNEQEIDGLAGELSSKNQQLQKEVRKRDKVEEGLKEKKKEAGKMSRELTKIEQRLKESVGVCCLCLCRGRKVPPEFSGYPLYNLTNTHINDLLIYVMPIVYDLTQCSCFRAEMS